MVKKDVVIGKLHKVPTDLQKVISSSLAFKEAWGNITILAKNEWICWIISAKKDETRMHRLNRTVNEIKTGKKRPCCFAGCPHR